MAFRAPLLQINDQLTIPSAELNFAYVRSSGPGGQNVNKVNSQAQLSWKLGDCVSLPADVLERLQIAEQGRISKAGLLRIESDRYRDREKNRQDCLDRLKAMIIAVSKPPKKRRKTRIPRGVVAARLRGKQQRSQVKQARRRPGLDD